MFDSSISNIGRNIVNIPGKRLNKKIVVFESDDWGSIRIPSTVAYKKLINGGINLETNPFNRFDTLESEEDLLALFDVLSSFRDKMGNHPIITTNFIMANPHFDKIFDSNFEQYFFEPIAQTYKSYSGRENVLEIIKNGINSELIYPQFHGREHLNVLAWLKLLRSGHNELLLAFDNRTFAIDVDTDLSERSNLMAAYDYNTDEEKEFVLSSIEMGYNMFKETFGYYSKSFIAPCYVWNSEVEDRFYQLGAEFIQCSLVQNSPSKDRNYKKSYKFFGNKSKFGQRYLPRNCYFEPSTINDYDWVGNCLSKIKAAFNWGNPAIISMHRANVMGALVVENRVKNLALLSTLLSEILRNWPDVEFIHTADLGEIYK